MYVNNNNKKRFLFWPFSRDIIALLYFEVTVAIIAGRGEWRFSSGILFWMVS